MGSFRKRSIHLETEMLLTVELKMADRPNESEVAICFDDEGIELLIKKLVRLRGVRDHEHLKTPGWAGAELTDNKQGGDEYTLLNHLQLVKR